MGNVKMKIYQIELTNYCNFKCDYCPRSEMKRDVGFMNVATLRSAIVKMEGTIVRLHHYGESTFHPDLATYITFIKQLKPDAKITLNTNGSTLSNDFLNSLFESGLNDIVISYHNERSVKELKKIIVKDKTKIKVIKIGEKDGSLDWIEALGYVVKYKRLRDLGQIEKHKILSGNPVDRCAFLRNNEVAVLWNGDIVPCCECYDDDVTLGNIKDTDVIDNKAFDMCKTCMGYGNDEKETEQFR